MSVLRLGLLVAALGGYFAVPSLTHCGGYAPWVFTNKNLTDIVTEWKGQCGGSVIDCSFDGVLAAQSMRPHLSPTRDRPLRTLRWDWEHAIRDSAHGFVLSAIFVALLAVTMKGRARANLLALALSSFGLAFSCASFAHWLSGWRYPGSHAFLDDFVYLDPPFVEYVDHAGQQHTLVAYQAQPEYRNARAVAMASGLVTHSWDEALEQSLNCANLSLLADP